MKTLPAGMQSHLASGATTLCWCFKLVRSDGYVLGFTDHDRPLILDGVVYDAASGFSPSAMQTQSGLAIDNLTATGALSSEKLNERDLSAGLYDNASVEMWRVNWSDVSQRVLMHKGNIGQVVRGRTGFSAELRGLSHILNQTTGRVYSHACDAALGDGRCGVDLAAPAFQACGVVASVTDARRFSVYGLDSFSSDWFARGGITFTSGGNLGLTMEIKRHSADAVRVAIELWQPMSNAIVAGDRFVISAGCDKQFATCRAKFANGANFQGFPYMPGSDAALGYPASSQPMDGKSRYGD